MKRLSKREQEYLDCLIRYPGDTQRQRARRMGCAYRTAVVYSVRLRKKTGSRNEIELAINHLKRKDDSA